MKYITVATMI